MSTRKLKTAILGLKEQGQTLLDIASAMPYFEIVAVADKDTELAEDTAKQFSCKPFDDYRQLVIQNELECLLVTAGLYSCHEFVRAAIKKKFNILKLAPAARNFEEAAELANLAKAENVKFEICLPSNSYASFTTLAGIIERKKLEQVSLVTAVCEYRNEIRPAWHYDPELAGGGVLLRDCYGVIDLLVETFGMPEQIYSLTSANAADRQQRHKKAEATASVTMKYTNDFCINLIATRSQGDDYSNEIITCFGKDELIIVDRESLELNKRNGENITDNTYAHSEQDSICKSVENYALSIILETDEQNEDKPAPSRCRIKNQLRTMAVIEAAYLSSRTAMPEEPNKILAINAVE